MLLFIIIVICVSESTETCVATRSVTHGKKYFLVFLPVHHEDGTIMKKGLDIVITLKTSSANYQPHIGMIIFDTCNSKRVLTQQLLTLYTDIGLLKESNPLSTCYDSISCANLYLDVVVVFAYMDPVSARMLGNFLQPENLAVIVKIDESKTNEPYDLMALNSFEKLLLVPDINPIKILLFLINYHKWSNLIVIVSDSVSQAHLEDALKNYCVQYIYVSPLAIYKQQNQMKYERLFAQINTSSPNVAVVVWSNSFQVAKPLMQRHHDLPPLLINWNAYKMHYIATQQHLKVYTISSIELDTTSYVKSMLLKAVTDKWVKEYLQEKNLTLSSMFLRWQENFHIMFRNFIIHYLMRDAPLVSGDYLFSQIKPDNRSKIMKMDNICNQLNCQPGSYPKWVTSYNKSYYDKSRTHQCISCKPGLIKPTFGNNNCLYCSNLTLLNTNRTLCLTKQSVFLHPGKKVTIAIYCFLFVGASLNAGFLYVFIKSRDTPLVRTSNARLSIIQMTAHLMLFLVLPAYIGKPNVYKCVFISSAIGFLFTLMLSITLAKSQKLLMIFRSPVKMQPSEIAMTMFVENLMLAISLMLQIILTFTSLILTEPKVTIVIESKHVCYACANEHLHYQMAFVFLMAVLCLIQAYRSRGLPSCYNENKFVVLSMSSLIVILSITIIPVTHLQDRTLKNIQSIYCANIIMLIIQYSQKTWLILFSPNRNTKDFLNNKRMKTIERINSVEQLVDNE